MNALITDRIRAAATSLGLTNTAETITEAVVRAEAGQLGYLDFLDQILAEEISVKDSRRFRYALQQSALPHYKTLDDFDYTFQPDLEPRRVRDLAALEFLNNASNVVLLGPPGVGKTHLAVALAVASAQAGHSIRYTTLDDLVRKLKAADATGRFNHQLAALARPALLVVDLCRPWNYADIGIGRRSGLPRAGPDRGEHVLPTRRAPLRTCASPR